MERPRNCDALQSRLQAMRTPRGQLVLPADFVPLGPVADFIALLPDQRLVLEKAQVNSPRAARITRVSVTGRVTGNWPVPHFDGTALTEIDVELVFDQPAPGQPIASALNIAKTKVASPQGAMALKGALQPGGALLLGAAPGEAAPTVNAGAIVAGLVDSPEAGAILRAVPLFASLPISGVSVTIGLGSATFTSAELAVRASGIWSILGNDVLALRDPGIAVAVTRRGAAGAPYGRQSHEAMLRATTLVGGAPFDVTLAISDASVVEVSISPQSGSVVPALADLARLIGGDAVGGALATGLNALGFDTIAIDSFQVGLDWSAPRLSWAALNGHFTLAGGTLNTTVQLLPRLAITATLPRAMAGSPTPHAAIRLDVLAAHVLGESAGLPATELDGFSLFADPGAGAYSVMAGIATDWRWQISDGGPAITLSDVTLNAAKGAGGVSGGLAVLWSIGGFDIGISGDYRGSGQGWLLSGSATQEQPADAGALLAELGSELGVGIPAVMAEAVSSLRIAQLGATLDTQSKSFEFNAEVEGGGDLPLGLGSYHADLRINLSSTLDRATGKRDFAGHFESELDIGDATFTIAYDFGPSRVIRGRWTSAGGETISLDDIAGKLGLDAIVDVPDGLDLTLNSASFEYHSDPQSFTLSATSSSFGDAFFTMAKGADGNWGFVFGVESPSGGKLSDLPVLGSALGPADFLSIEKAAFIVASNAPPNYVLPALPAVPAAGPAGRPNSPVASGMTLQLATGISVVAVIDLATSSDPVLGNFRTIVGTSKLALQVAVTPSSVSLFAGLAGSVKIPAGGSSLVLSNAGVRIEAGALPSFQIYGSLAFAISGTPVRATARLLLAPTEAQVAMELAAEQGSLPGPPGIKGLHFEQFGVMLGVFFAPPAVDLGVQGRFRIGEEQALRADEFAFVLQIIEEVPNLLYLSFYIDKMDLGQVVTLFTDADEPDAVKSLEIVKASNLSFHWCEMPVMLPDGTMTKPGFGFSAAIDILAFGAHAELEVSSLGIRGMAEMAPIDIRGILQVSGDGKGMFRTYEEVGGVWKEIANNAVVRQRPPRPTRRDTLVAAGGPVVLFNATGSPFVHVSAYVSLFDLVRDSIDMTVGTDGLSFALGYDIAGIEKFTLNCLLTSSGFAGRARFGFHIDASIGPIHVLGIDMGSIHLSAGFDAAIALAIDANHFALRLEGGFEFMGIGLNMPTLTIDVAFSSLKDLPGYAVQQIQNFADEIFEELMGDATRWARMIADGIITGVTEIAKKLKEVYNLAAEEAARVMRLANQGVEAIAAGLNQVYGLGQDAAAIVMKGAGFAAAEVGRGLISAYDATQQGVATALRGAQFAADETGEALRAGFNATAEGAAQALQGAGYAAEETGKALSTGWNATAQGAATALRGAGYAVEEVGGALQSAYGATADVAAQALRGAGYAAEETGRALNTGWGATAAGAAIALKGAGYAVDEVGGAMRSAYGASADVAAQALRGAGYALDQTGNFLKNSFGMAPDALNSALQGAGYAAEEVGSFFQGLGGSFTDFGNDMKKGFEEVGEALDPTGW
jgi:hypothetical protein